MSAELISKATDWFQSKGWKPFPFQEEAWEKYAKGRSGLVNAPTGSGKTYSLLLPAMLAANPKKKGLKVIWITPIRALSKEIEQASKRAVEGLSLDWEVGVRTGDTSQKEKQKQRVALPDLLITTPESLHLLMSQKRASHLFRNLECIVVDEWHELLGSKRAVQVELALSKLKSWRPKLRVWGISATIGNMDDAMDILMGTNPPRPKPVVIRANHEKQIEVVSILPDDVTELPWAGHLGIRLLEKVIPTIKSSKSCLIFTNTRSQAEIWYQRILEVAPELAGWIGMHHGSIDKKLRHWVEDALHTGDLKAVVCTSSLDLGVDFRPVETIIQIGSPKGVARFIQRAGRSGHQPGATSKIYFVPTHTLELIEASALRAAINQQIIEERMPYVRSFDVLLQWLVTLAVGEGFYASEALEQLRSTVSFGSITDREWQWCLNFITHGGEPLEGYDEFHRVEVDPDGKYVVNSRKVSFRHRLSMGTIVSEGLMKVRLASGGFLGTIEEYFISRLKVGEVFWFAGRNLELIEVRGMTVKVRKAMTKAGKVPSWQGGRMPLSAQLGAMLRVKLGEAYINKITTAEEEPELHMIQPLIELQAERSMVPSEKELLIEYFESDEGYHLFIYPFEGRLVHEGMAALIAYRLGLFSPITFSIAMNDYGFELLSDQPIPIEDAIDSDIFSTTDLREDIQASVNETEMARRRFRDIAHISGLVFGGYPGKPVKVRHLQSNSQLFFNVFLEDEPDNLLLLEAYEEVHTFQLEEARMRAAMERIMSQEIRLIYMEKPSPLSFPIMVDRLREKISSESLQDQVKRMQEW
ncbi:ligase-associated DNA damage response DEXH box helicase [Phaeocystidibacter luteus]|uniref:Ligase-associated DNA damage response DEXH box helicase n=1 Tax=Phaeocystidibacter luteus TaxID=911197 RepID=A0A6N6REP3_9FLAO|nr:ligase-associated DNA damage response DEXH box helicase [Phaeocystidibacter luteus]KAB2808667.1 ligase-associated DNA damage response DEXH box helicase [Phaeocystidibacter luteus]